MLFILLPILLLPQVLQYFRELLIYSKIVGFCSQENFNTQFLVKEKLQSAAGLQQRCFPGSFSNVSGTAIQEKL